MMKPSVLLLLILTPLAGCTAATAPKRGIEAISLATAQRFHAKMDAIAERSGFDCRLDGFPDWKQGSGVRPAVGPLGQWNFVTSEERDVRGHLSEPGWIALAVQLQPKSETPASKGKWLCEFEGLDVVVTRRHEHDEEGGKEKFGPRRSTEALVALLRETPDQRSSILDAAVRRLMAHYQTQKRKTPTAFFLSIDGEDPSQECLARFSSCRPKVRPGSEFGKKAEDVRINVGTLTVYWHAANRVQVGYSYDLIPQSLWWSGSCLVENVDGRWAGAKVTLGKGGRRLDKSGGSWWSH